MEQEKVMEKLKQLVDKRYIYLFPSGDDAIFALLSSLSKKYHKILIPDCGGWFSYNKMPKKFGMEIVEIKTDDALIDLIDLGEKFSPDSLVMVNSMGGYFVEEPMDSIQKICGSNLINDVSASIDREYAKIGELCVGSFGEDKPLDLGYGGFIGSNRELPIQSEEIREGFYAELDKAIDLLDEKLAFWDNHRINVIKDLGKHEILHKESRGINVVVAYKTEEEMKILIQYSEENGIEFKKCPNYIKVMRPAISIEIKRIKFKYN